MATATLLPPPRAVFYDQLGNPLSGGYVYTFVPGGMTPKLSWQDAAETTPNSNPIILDNGGSCLLYGSGQYQITVTDSLGNQVPAYSGVTVDTITNLGISPVMLPVVQAASIDAAWVIFGQVPTTGEFYQNDGAIVDRLNDRIFVAGACANDGCFPNVNQDWLTMEPGLGWPVFTAQMAVLSDTNQIAFTAASRTSDQAPVSNNGGNGSAIGIGGWAINDWVSPTGFRYAWAGYFEGRTAQQNQGPAYGLEVDIYAYGGREAPPTPYAVGVLYGGYGISIACGAGQTNATDATAGLTFINNGAKFINGIAFDANSLTGADGTVAGGAEATAISLGYGQGIQWFQPNNLAGPRIVSSQTNQGPTSLSFSDSGMSWQANATTLFIVHNTSPASGFTNLGIIANNSLGVSLQTVSLGAADSGGTGFRCLTLPN